MAQIPFKHPECNGWAIYDSTNIAAKNSNNMHIAEVRIEEKDKGSVSVYLNDDDGATGSDMVTTVNYHSGGSL